MTKQLQTSRLILRRWKDSDLAPFSKMNMDPRVMEYFPKTLTKEESDSFVTRIEEHFAIHGYGLWAVELVDTQQLIGFIGFNHATLPGVCDPCIEIGWRLSFESWGKGYATEGAKACLRYGFETLNFSEIFSFTAVVNKRSSKVMEKLGMVFAKEFDHPRLEKNHLLSRHVLYKIDKDVWLSLGR